MGIRHRSFQTIEDSLNPSGKWFSSRSNIRPDNSPIMDYITITEEEYERCFLVIQNLLFVFDTLKIIPN